MAAPLTFKKGKFENAEMHDFLRNEIEGLSITKISERTGAQISTLRRLESIWDDVTLPKPKPNKGGRKKQTNVKENQTEYEVDDSIITACGKW